MDKKTNPGCITCDIPMRRVVALKDVQLPNGVTEQVLFQCDHCKLIDALIV